MKLEIGYNFTFEIRKETCIANCIDSFSIAYLSDLHLNRFSKNIIESIVMAINNLNPTIILLGGDYVDSKKGFIYFNQLMAAISHRKNVFAIAGNHDYGFKFNHIKKIVTDYNAVWIDKESINLKLENTTISVDGNIIKQKKDNIDFSILLLHKPINAKQFQDRYNIAFAGHLHGCQFVFWQRTYKLYPGKLFYKWNILKVKINDCQYFISKGLGDTLPIRYNCKRDLLFIMVTPKS